MTLKILMGCISTKSDTCANVFQVVNVDDYGNQLNAGQLEVTTDELVFYQRGKQPIRWPLKTLRRYGYDAEHFSFESGRRGPTGAGIYAFLCKRAEELVSLLEARLQVRANAENDSENSRRFSHHRLSSISSGGPLSPVSNTAPLLANLPAVPVPAARPISTALYVNDSAIANLAITGTGVSDSQDETNNNKLHDTGTEHAYTNIPAALDGDELPNAAHIYMNIVPGTDSTVQDFQVAPQPAPLIPWDQDESSHNYANLDLVADDAPLNYIVLDLDAPPKSPTNSLPPDSPRKSEPTLGYATIDFDKTTALSHSVDPSFDDSESSRKTRHNSQISQLPRHSSSISD